MSHGEQLLLEAPLHGFGMEKQGFGGTTPNKVMFSAICKVVNLLGTHAEGMNMGCK